MHFSSSPLKWALFLLCFGLDSLCLNYLLRLLKQNKVPTLCGLKKGQTLNTYCDIKQGCARPKMRQHYAFDELSQRRLPWRLLLLHLLPINLFFALIYVREGRLINYTKAMSLIQELSYYHVKLYLVGIKLFELNNSGLLSFCYLHSNLAQLGLYLNKFGSELIQLFLQAFHL